MAPPAKRRKTESKTEEITFDLSARQEYLTGFHKRKIQRAKQAQEAAERRAREDRIAERKRIREERKADLERHVREVNALLRPAERETNANGNGSSEDDGDVDADGDDWKGIEDNSPPPIDHEAEYIDEDKYTTVTVETMDVSRDGLANFGNDSKEAVEQTRNTSKSISPDIRKKVTKVKSATDQQRNLQSKLNKKKRKNFKYESKVDRKVSRMKEKFKNSKQAKARKTG